MNHGSLFSGIGGFDLAAEWMGWTNKFHCEWNPFGQKVLKHYWPQAESYSDITKTDFSVWRGRIDILTGGFPCQPYSTAGKRLGKEDERHLWPEMLRAIREIQPQYVVGENVSGLVNWNGGMVFEEVQAELEAERYEVRPFILPACAVNAPHRRDRVWFVAHSMRSGHRGKSEKAGSNLHEERTICEDIGQYGDGVWCKTKRCCEIASDTSSNGLHEQPTKKDKREWKNNKQSGSQRISTAQRPSNEWNVTNSDNERLQRSELNGSPDTERQKRGGQPSKSTSQFYQISDWRDFPTAPPVHTRNDGISDRLDTSSISFSKWRNESIKASGNAIVPQVALQIFKAIQEFEQISQ